MKTPDPNRLRDAGNIPQETLDYLRDRRRQVNGERAAKVVKGTGVALKVILIGAGSLLLLLLVLGIVGLMLGDKTHEPPEADRTTTIRKAPLAITESPKKPQHTSILATCSISDAEEVLGKSSVLFDVESDGATILYTARTNTWEVLQPKMEKMIEAIADADACKSHEARLIVFKDPNGNEVGVADPIRGIRYEGR